VIIYGISAQQHDASVAVVADDEILFASSSERYSRVKNDPRLNSALIDEARTYGEPDLVVWYERPFLRRTREVAAGQHRRLLGRDGARYLRQFGLRAPVRYISHHESHAAAGFFTAPFDEAAILVIDAIGEWDTISAWRGSGARLTKLWSQRYPHSLGLLYSAFTQRVGLTPNEEEFILMGLAALGRPLYRDLIWDDFIARFEPPSLVLKRNVHRGIRWWRPELADRENIAASIQAVTEEIVIGLVEWLSREVRSRNLVLMGGVALNCVANSRIAQAGIFDDIWIMPNPGDGGSAIGAATAHSRKPVKWSTPFLGHDIHRPLDLRGILDALGRGELIGIANGRAEFGPRALGNRSLLADPRGPDVKDRVNRVKQREPFRPFAPIILAQDAKRFFDMPVRASPYMQFVARVRHPDRFPAITHVDKTARVQTVTREQHPQMHALLQAFREMTGCPMLLNTSLNVKGEPLVNTWADAQRFASLSGVKVY
jgi:carbamoyltransferase